MVEKSPKNWCNLFQFSHQRYHGHTLNEQLEQAQIPSDSTIRNVYVDLGYRGEDGDYPALPACQKVTANKSIAICFLHDYSDAILRTKLTRTIKISHFLWHVVEPICKDDLPSY
jgi:hypothetical protein